MELTLVIDSPSKVAFIMESQGTPRTMAEKSRNKDKESKCMGGTEWC